MDFSRFFLIILARRKLILATLIITILTTLIVSLLLPKSYLSTATLVLTYKGADPVTGAFLPAQLNPSFMATQLDVIKSTRTALMVIDQLGLLNNEALLKLFEESNINLGLREWLAAFLLKNLDIETSRDSSVIGFSYKGADPMFATIMANAFANAYQEISIRLTVEPSQKAAAYFTDQLNVLREKFEIAQKKLTDYQNEVGIVDADTRLDVETRRLNDLSTQLIIAQAELMGTDPEVINRSGETSAVAKNSMISNLKLSLAQAESKFSDVSQKLGPNHPSYMGAKAEVEKLRTELNKYVRNTMHTAIGQEAEIRAALEEQKTKVLSLNRARNELHILFKEAEGAQQAYDNAMLRLNQTTLEGQANLSSVSILDPAKIPEKPHSPKLFLNMILSVILGTLLGLGAGLVAEMVDRRVRSPEDLVDVFKVPVLGVIQKETSKQKRLQLNWPRLIR